ncbi:T9SS type A sorting domain-containing protein [Chryseobacterium sp. MEBOG07]|uniref:T9SS type A sorting domain-containing protein n=1 Tax=Chryseobacterium sp. MEBOG07 TaxID=2879939 RepID=UPI001F30F7F8|nr:T9SS type A sorting domain-containing protein [Chryseobacterium sp. MEBOG07]UKB78687.1 T9SS type A sorting domain-containing protein [Chryseobacterium sp. MEBOG07]
MIKQLILIFILLTQCAFSQIISKDNSFASNGKFTIPGNNNYWSRMIQNPDGSIYFTYNKNDSSGAEKFFLSKLTANGIVDTSFGTNGEMELPYFSTDSQLKKQSDGKLLAFGFYNGTAITRILQNGQLDTTFGVNGTSLIPELSADQNDTSYGLIPQNGKLIVHGMEGTAGQIHHKIYRLDSNGIIDSTFGNNGSVLTQGTWSNGPHLLIDNQFNLVNLTNNGIMEKFDSNGQPLTNFGNNGVLQISYSFSNFGFGAAAFMDSNNNIIYSSADSEIIRIKPDGTVDSSFNFDPATLPPSVWKTNIIEKNGYYYISGMNEDSAPTYFISRLTQNGSIDPVFNYFIETDSTLVRIEDLIVNDNNIIANGGGYVVKYLLNSSLSTAEIAKPDTNITFENPVKESFIYISKNKISNINIYSIDGKLLKTFKKSNTSASDLTNGIYIANIIFENGTSSTMKLIKN